MSDAEPDYGIDVAILIVSWNAKQYLENCLESLFNTACDLDFSIWVVDNDSSDGSVDMVKRNYPQVNLVESGANLGFAAGNNLGLEQIQSQKPRYICLLNSDTKVRDYWLDELFAHMEEHPNVGLSSSRIENADHSLQASCMHSPSYWNVFCRTFALDRLFPDSAFWDGGLMYYWAHDTTRKVEVLFGCLWMARAEAIAEVGHLDTDFFMYAEDLDWCLRFRQANWLIHYYPQTAIIHYGGGSSINAPVRFYQEEKRSLLYYWRKHHGFLGLVFIYLMSVLHEFLRVLMFGSRCIRRTHKMTCSAKFMRSFKTFFWLLGLPKLRLNQDERP